MSHQQAREKVASELQDVQADFLSHRNNTHDSHACSSVGKVVKMLHEHHSARLADAGFAPFKHIAAELVAHKIMAADQQTAFVKQLNTLADRNQDQFDTVTIDSVKTILRMREVLLLVVCALDAHEYYGWL